MTAESTAAAHWSFWVIGIATLLYNLAGVVNFTTQMNPDNIAAMPEIYRAIIEGRPFWATGAFGLAVIGGVLGCSVLLLRKPMALYVFAASLVGAVLTMLQALGVGSTAASPPEFMIGNVVQILVTVFLIWYANWSDRKGWLSN